MDRALAHLAQSTPGEEAPLLSYRGGASASYLLDCVCPLLGVGFSNAANGRDAPCWGNVRTLSTLVVPIYPGSTSCRRPEERLAKDASTQYSN
jgi:hypothetical protein